MFKRAERKRKRLEEEEDLGLDEDAKEILGLNDTDSDESDSESGSEQDSGRESTSDQFDPDELDPGTGEGGDQDQNDESTVSEDEDLDEDPQISVEDALKDPIYLISLDPTIHGCILCKGKLIKNAGMASTHKNANAHKRRFEHFRRLSAHVDSRNNAWELAQMIRSASSVSMQKVGSREPSKRALKRQAKQIAIRDKRKRHKELKAKALAKKALKGLSAVEETPPKVGTGCSPRSQNQPRMSRKKRKSESETSTSKTRSAIAKSAPRIRPSSDVKKSIFKSGIKTTKKADKSP